MSTAALHPLVIPARAGHRTLRLYRPESRTGVEWSVIAVLSLTGLTAWLYAAVELAVGLIGP